MGLSRLDNFLKNTKGNLIYVNPNDIDATDAIENQGNSLTRPFKTIQRALIEAARFSYQSGRNNDRFGKTTVLVYPGEHVVDNRPGWIPVHDTPINGNNYLLRSSATSDNLIPFRSVTNFNVNSADNDLYKLNSIHGGVIIPRGVSLVGVDLRKTKIRPKYVPSPENDDIERSAIFRVTGSCFFFQFSIFDADPNGVIYKDYTDNLFVPNFSHHKLSCFEYADGVNPVSIDDQFITYSTSRTDLDMYYEKIGLVYGPSSGRPIPATTDTLYGDYPAVVDIEKKVDEYRIVGSTGLEVGISTITATAGSTAITVGLQESLPGLEVDTPIQINGVGANGYDGQYVVSEVLDSKTIKYEVQNTPLNLIPPIASATLSLSVDTVTSASPYIFNVSLRSVWGMCGMLADGSKADGFKSMVVAQFTGIGLQKDNNAFVKYKTSETEGLYQDTTASGNENIHTDSLARYKPTYENFHIKAINDSFLQLVSVFAIGYAAHFVAESGGDLSITNSNSNFGAKALVADGYKSTAFAKDDTGYITHIIPPKQLETLESSVEYIAVDVGVTTGIGSTSRLYLYNQTNSAVLPDYTIDGYRIGAKVNDKLNVILSKSGISTQYSARIIMPNTQNNQEISFEKSYFVGKSTLGINSISSSTITFTEPHSFLNGESVRVISLDGNIPDGIRANQLYYVITSGIGSDQIKLAQTFNNTITNDFISINNRGGTLKVVSRVSDKKSGDIGHPIGFDTSVNQWYVNVATAASENSIYPALSGLGGVAVLGSATPRTFITRRPDTRNLVDTIYRARYVIPADSFARPPLDGFVIQESSETIGITTSEVESYSSILPFTLANTTQLRNFRIISNAEWSSNVAKYTTELPHELSAGSEVEILNIKSANNSTGVGNSGFNGIFTVTQINNSKQFSVTLNSAVGPGTFTSDTSLRNVSLPYFKRKKYSNTYTVYRSQEVQKHVRKDVANGISGQDGIYHLLLVNNSNSPDISPFTDLNFSQPIQNLYPQTNRDNPNSDPRESTSFSLPDPIGQVVVNDPQYSITKETVNKIANDFGLGIGVTNVYSTSGSDHIIHTEIDHGLNRITRVGIVSAGLNYGSGIGVTQTFYNARLVGFAGSTTGDYATARVTVNNVGSITAVKIIDGGSAYGIGNTLTVVGIATTTGHIVGVVSVTSIYNNVGDSLKLDGIISDVYTKYNTLYRITGIDTGSTKIVKVSSASTLSSPYAVSGIGNTVAANAFISLTGQALKVNSIQYNPVSGLATVTTQQRHGLFVNNSVKVGGANNSFYNGDFIIKKIQSSNSFQLFIGISTVGLSTSGNIYAFRTGYSANGGNVSIDDENVSGRMVSEYAGITTTISAPIVDELTTTVEIANLTTLDLQIGDHLEIDNEIVRIKTTVLPADTTVSVFRGVLGTRPTQHDTNSVIRKIKPRPIELRRNSIIRASGHTFEYVGFGPGNYSTALPSKQNRQITAQEEILSQSFKTDGGLIVYTGMNNDGDFYIGNKKVSSANGQEEVFDAPIPTITGDDISSGGFSLGFDVLTPLEASISRSLRVEGGPNADIVSEFDGPIIFNNKVTSNSEKGIEAYSIYLQGDATISRKYTVGIATPSTSGTPGDVVFRSEPVKGGTVGWVYTTDNDWYPFGNISISKNSRIGIFDQVGINTTDPGTCLLSIVGSASTYFCFNQWGVGINTNANATYDLNLLGTANITGDLYVTGTIYGAVNIDSLWSSNATGIHTTRSVGIATTSAKANTALYVNGKTEINGALKVVEVIEKATVNTSTVPTGTLNIDLAENNVYYYTQQATGNWTINFRGNSGQTLDNFLEVGDSITVAIITTQGVTPYYNNIIRIDGLQVTPKYYGGTQILSGNSSGIDMYTYVIVRKANSSGPSYNPNDDFTVLYSQSQYA
jgi:hypothetical protein